MHALLPRRTGCVLVALLAVPLIRLGAAAPVAPILGVVGDVACETGSPMRDLLHAGHKVPPLDWRTQSGAMGVNARWEVDQTLPWFIEDQRPGGDYVAAGLAFGNPDQVRWGLKVVSWGFGRMTPTGEFPHHDGHHSASFFVEATAHALLLLQSAPVQTADAESVDVLKPKPLLAARWMARPDVDAKAWGDSL